jgi:hypothetical protein
MSTPNESAGATVPTGEADKPDAASAMLAMAKAGDLAGLLDAIIKRPPAAGDLRKIDVLLRGSVRLAGKNSPRRFTKAVFREVMAFVAYVQMRLHVHAVQCLAADELPGQQSSDELTSKLLPRIEQFARLTQELAQSWATTSRQWELARHARNRASGRRPPPRSLNESYRRLVEDGILPEITTCETDSD